MSFKPTGELVLEHITQKKLLPVYSEDTKWVGTDTHQRYVSSLKTQSKDWSYRTKVVNYNLNSDHYRTAEFKDINWSTAVVIFGCSNIFGMGVDESETVSYFLSNILNRPVINLGVGSSSMTFAFHNSIMLSEGFPTPWAVIQVWSEISRCVCYAPEGPVHHGVWNIEDHEYMKQWALHEYNPKTHSMLISLASRAVWGNKTKFIEASYFKETASAVGCLLLDQIDHARDLGHPGPVTNQLTAKILSEELLKCK